MDNTFEQLREKYPDAILNIRVDKFDVFLTYMQKMMRKEFERESKVLQHSSGDTFYSFRRVASILDVSERTLNRWQTQGYLVPIMIGGQRRYRKSDIERIISEGLNGKGYSHEH